MTAVEQVLRQGSSLDQIWDVVQDAKPQISFWGARYLRCKNGNILFFSTLMDRTEPYMSRNLPEPQREKLLQVVGEIENFFSRAETLLPRVNTIARKVLYVRESLGTRDTYSRWILMKTIAYNPQQTIQQNEDEYWTFSGDVNISVNSKDDPMNLLETWLPPCIGEIFPL